MNIRTQTGVLLAGLALATCFGAVAQPASSNGRLMDLTIHTSQKIHGMSVGGEHTIHKKICAHPGQFDPSAYIAAGKHNNDCTVEHYKKDGKTITFDVVCTKPGAITSHGVFHMTGGGGFTGTLHTVLSGAVSVVVDARYAGKQVGTCNYTPS